MRCARPQAVNIAPSQSRPSCWFAPPKILLLPINRSPSRWHRTVYMYHMNINIAHTAPRLRLLSVIIFITTKFKLLSVHVVTAMVIKSHHTTPHHRSSLSGEMSFQKVRNSACVISNCPANSHCTVVVS
jgi:hypothetical protein